jgi:hypothetical protein
MAIWLYEVSVWLYGYMKYQYGYMAIQTEVSVARAVWVYIPSVGLSTDGSISSPGSMAIYTKCGTADVIHLLHWEPSHLPLTPLTTLTTDYAAYTSYTDIRNCGLH